jgi:hypothetical protein
MTNQVILEGTLSLSGKDNNLFPIKFREGETKKGEKFSYYERFSTVSVARSTNGSNWDNVPVIVKSKNEDDLIKLEKLNGKTIKCKGSVRTSYNEETKKGSVNVVTGSMAEVTEQEKEERRRAREEADMPKF